jgi:hypothetical protein
VLKEIVAHSVCGVAALAFVTGAARGLSARHGDARRTAPLEERALEVFTEIGRREPAEILRMLRPPSLDPALRRIVLDSLPREEHVNPSKDDERRLASLASVLRLHERETVWEYRLLRLGHPFVGLHGRAVLLIDRNTLAVTTEPELVALVAHEMGHDYFWGEYWRARSASDVDTVRALELRCDVIAILTLAALERDTGALASAVRKLTRYNVGFGADSSFELYCPLPRRTAFIERVRAMVTTRPL